VCIPKTSYREDGLAVNQLIAPIPNAQEMIGGVCRTTLYKLVSDGEIELVKIGRRSFITVASLTAYVGRLSESTALPVDSGG